MSPFPTSSAQNFAMHRCDECSVAVPVFSIDIIEIRKLHSGLTAADAEQRTPRSFSMTWAAGSAGLPSICTDGPSDP
jgi:hypothetical protein